MEYIELDLRLENVGRWSIVWSTRYRTKHPIVLQSETLNLSVWNHAIVSRPCSTMQIRYDFNISVIYRPA